MSALGEGGVSAPGGSVLEGDGASAPGGVSAPGGCGIPACTEADTPPVNRMTDMSKNITLATTLLRPVIKESCSPGARCPSDALVVVATSTSNRIKNKQ